MWIKSIPSIEYDNYWTVHSRMNVRLLFFRETASVEVGVKARRLTFEGLGEVKTESEWRRRHCRIGRFVSPSTWWPGLKLGSLESAPQERWNDSITTLAPNWDCHTLWWLHWQFSGVGIFSVARWFNHWLPCPMFSSGNLSMNLALNKEINDWFSRLFTPHLWVSSTRNCCYPPLLPLVNSQFAILGCKKCGTL